MDDFDYKFMMTLSIDVFANSKEDIEKLRAVLESGLDKHLRDILDSSGLQCEFSSDQPGKYTFGRSGGTNTEEIPDDFRDSVRKGLVY